jgi:hypothetical protein
MRAQVVKNTTGPPSLVAVQMQAANRLAQNNMTKRGGRRRRKRRGGGNVPQFANGGDSNDAIYSAARTEANLKNLRAIQGGTRRRRRVNAFF